MRVIGIACALLFVHTFARADSGFYIVAGASYVDPRMESQNLQLNTTGLAAVAVTNPSLDGSGMEVSTATFASAIIGYALPVLERRLSIETIVAPPMTLKSRATGKLANESLPPSAFGFIPTGIPPLGSEMGEGSSFSPIVTAVFRIAQLGPLAPYVGAGPSIMVVTDAKITNPVLTAAGAPTFSIDPAYGVVLQTGLDVHLWSSFFARVDFKYIAYTSSHATISNIKVNTTIPFLDTVDVGSAQMDVTANPIVLQGGVGARF